MSKAIFNSVLAGMLLLVAAAESKELAAKLTVGNKTFEGVILGFDGDLLNFRPTGRAGSLSWPVDAVKEAEFPVDLDQMMLRDLSEKRLYDQLIPLLETAIAPFAEYSELPSNLATYQAMLMELYYKVGDFDNTLRFAAILAKDNRNPDVQRKSLVYEGLSLMEEDRFDEAERLFAEQGWTKDLANDAPAEDLYITAKFLAMQGDYSKALEVAAKVVVFDSQDPDWMRPAELLCGEMYAELGMLDSAEEVVREITLLYKDTDEADQARKLKVRIAKLRSEMAAAENK